VDCNQNAAHTTETAQFVTNLVLSLLEITCKKTIGNILYSNVNNYFTFKNSLMVYKIFYKADVHKFS
jgi:hypothetical protein